MKRLFTVLIVLAALVMVFGNYDMEALEKGAKAAEPPESRVASTHPANTVQVPQATPPARETSAKRKPDNNGGVILILISIAIIVVALMILSGKPPQRKHR